VLLPYSAVTACPSPTQQRRHDDTPEIGPIFMNTPVPSF
jgi:hypothetical protein